MVKLETRQRDLGSLRLDRLAFLAITSYVSRNVLAAVPIQVGERSQGTPT